MEQELKRLLEQKELVNAMKKSAHEAEQKLVQEMQEFFTKHLGFSKGAEFHLLDAVLKAYEAKQ